MTTKRLTDQQLAEIERLGEQCCDSVIRESPDFWQLWDKFKVACYPKTIISMASELRQLRAAAAEQAQRDAYRWIRKNDPAHPDYDPIS